MENKRSYGYGKRPLWMWIAIYLIIGAIIYGIIYYFFLATGNNAVPYRVRWLLKGGVLNGRENERHGSKNER